MGRRTLLRALGDALRVPTLLLEGRALRGQGWGSGAYMVGNALKAAEKLGPFILAVEDFEVVARRRAEYESGQQSSALAVILQACTGARSCPGLLLVAGISTASWEDLDERVQALATEVQVPCPDLSRWATLWQLHARHLSPD
eukprot:RCo048332